MTYPKLHITNGPGVRDLEHAFTARNLGATATFTIFLPECGPILFRLQILNFAFVTCQGPNYKLGGILSSSAWREPRLPPFNFIFVEYNAEKRTGMMEFSNAG
ncbi:MAG: hypothetical protein AAB472_01655 [Patescibacteria group bacterium]